MPLITPETSSSSRDSAIVRIRSRSLPSNYTSRQTFEETIKTRLPLGPEHLPGRVKDTVIILGPFGSQTHDLTSSYSSDSSQRSREARSFTPIQVPVPAYEDCFGGPELFDQVDYELSSSDVDLDEDINDADEDASGVCASSSRKNYGPPTWEPDHTQIVKELVEATDSLFQEDPKSDPHVHSPGSDHRISKRPRLSTTSPDSTPSSKRGEAYNGQGDDFFFPSELEGHTSTRGDGSYTIPQLRGLTLDDNPIIEDDTCEACFVTSSHRSMKWLAPCHHNVCKRCFSAALGSVSQEHPISSCPKCSVHVTGFAQSDSKIRRSIQAAFEHPVVEVEKGPIIMRIDNVAWDLTPEVVELFLPAGTLSTDTPVPIHIPLNRYDGRTKDFMVAYIEVASGAAARRILQSCQNTYMPGGPLTSTRKRAVTITQVPHMELILELRPDNAAELYSLLSLCQASVVAIPPYPDHTSSPSGVAHFVKNRHGPFNALMSILSKIKGKESPSYWDLFHVTSGAIAALASNISRLSLNISADVHHVEDFPIAAEEVADVKEVISHDQKVLDKLVGMFNSAFGVKLEAGRLSPT